MGQVWLSADCDGVESDTSGGKGTAVEGGRGSVFAVTAQNANLDTPVNTAPCDVTVHWSPENSNDTDLDRVRGFYSQHPTGANFGFADGSTRFLSETVDIQVYRDLSTIRGGEIIPAF